MILDYFWDDIDLLNDYYEVNSTTVPDPSSLTVKHNGISR
jgi:hypothetical protein